MPKKNLSPQITPSLRGKSIIIEKFNVLLQPLKERHERHYRDSQFHLWADLILAALLIGSATLLAWLLVWQPRPVFSLDLKTPTSRIVSGQSQEFIISYKNQEGEMIQGATLAVRLPDNFIFETAAPAALFDVSAQTFLLGDLKAGEQGELRLQGIIRGSISESQTITLNLFYQYKGIRKQLLTSFGYQIDSSALTLTLEMPETAFQNIPVSGVLEVKNIGRSTLAKAAVAFISPDWEITLADGTLADGRLVVPLLEPGESKRFAFSAITEITATQLPFVVEGQLLAETAVLKQTEVSRSLNLAEPSLAVTATWQDNALAGREASLNFNFKNNEQSEISKITFSFQSQRDSATLLQVSSTDNNFIAANNVLSYKEALAAGAVDKGTALLTLERKNISFNDFLSIGLTVSYEMNSQSYSYLVTAPTLKINSNLSVSSAGYYYSSQGDQLGVGPLPPKVDIPTTYWIIWEANNLGNDVSNFEVSADLPANVVWLDQKSLLAGEVSYSPVSRKILWRLDKLALSGGNYRANFAISIVPSQNEVGTTPTLLRNISFLGTDDYTGALISKNLANITTNIESDRHAAGKGKVEPLE